MYDKELVLDILEQIIEACEIVQERCKFATCENETVWLNRNQISELFGRDVKTIGKHIGNVFRDGELERFSTVAKFATVQNEGGRKVQKVICPHSCGILYIFSV